MGLEMYLKVEPRGLGDRTKKQAQVKEIGKVLA